MNFHIFTRRMPIDKDANREKRIIKLSDNSYHIVWAEDYEKWLEYYKGSGKLKKA